MFDFLKKKIGAFFGKKEEKPVVEEKPKEKTGKEVKPAVKAKSAKAPKPEKKPKEKPSKKPEKKIEKKEEVKEIKKEKTKEEIKEQIAEKPVIEEKEEIKETIEQPKEEVKVEEAEPAVKQKEEPGVEEEKPKQGFFKKLFKKPKPEEKKPIVDEQPKEIIEPEEEKVEEEIEEKEEEQGFFSKLIKKVTSGQKLSQDQFDEIFNDFEITLLENNVALEAVDKIRDSLAHDLVNQEIKKTDAQEKVLSALKNSILSLLIEPPNFLEQINNKPGVYTILFFGINGTGKTTSIAKIAHLLKQKNISCCLAAADTFRAASIEQLKIHADNVGVPIISSKYGADPASVAFEAKKYAQSKHIKVVLIDTAGRMYTKDNLLKEMEKIVRVSQPDLKIFVGESITGNDAVQQAKTFNETAGIDGIILSKADVDEKAGSILSVSHVTNKPIYFLGTGQNYQDLLIFTKKEVLKNLGLE